MYVTEIIITMKKHVALMDTILLEELVNWTDSLWRKLFSQNVKYNLIEIKIKNSSLQLYLSQWDTYFASVKKLKMSDSGLRNIFSSFKISTITFGLFTPTQIKYKVFILQNDDVSLLCTNFTLPFFQKNQLFWSFFVPFVFLFLAILLCFSKEVKSVWFLRNIFSSFKTSTITFGLFTLT